MKKLAGAVLTLTLISGCMTNKYTIGDGAKTTAANKVDKRWDLHFIYGFVGKGRVSVNCPSGNATAITQISALNAIVQGLTIGLVNPSTTTVWCEKVAKVEIQLTPEQMQAVAMSPEFLKYIEETAPEQANAVRAAQAEAKRQAEAAASNDKD